MKYYLIIIISSLLLISCTNSELANKLAPEIEKVKGQIAEVEKDKVKYGEGSVLHAMTTMRIEILKNNLAMLEQKLYSAWYYPQFSYTINSESYSPPANKEELIAKLKKEMQGARDEQIKSQGKAEGMGGLLGIIASMEVETKALEVAQLEYQLSAYQYDFPPLFMPVKPDELKIDNTSFEKTITASKTKSQTKPPKKRKPSKAEIEAKAMKKALSVTLNNKKYVPKDYDVNRYSDYCNFEFEYKNNSKKDIRAFTGVVVLSDIFDREFFRVGLTVDNSISAGKTVTDSDRSIKLNQFSDEHKKLINTKMENLRVGFEPRSIMFTDGSKLGTVK